MVHSSIAHLFITLMRKCTFANECVSQFLRGVFVYRCVTTTLLTWILPQRRWSHSVRKWNHCGRAWWSGQEDVGPQIRGLHQIRKMSSASCVESICRHEILGRGLSLAVVQAPSQVLLLLLLFLVQPLSSYRDPHRDLASYLTKENYK